MPRRPKANESGVRGSGQVNSGSVWRVFGCSNPSCGTVLRLEEDEFVQKGNEVQVECMSCAHLNNITAVAKGSLWKFCRVCEQLQPLQNFDVHRRTRSGRQYECKSCKRIINAELNPKRTRDQHREASERRRLYGTLAGESRVAEKEVYERFGRRCFNCGSELALGTGRLDHTLPARYLWPLSLGPTLLCADCNGAKAERWPSEFYMRDPETVDRAKLQQLSYLTGIPYEDLAGPPKLNPAAIHRILNDVDTFLVRWIRYPEELRRLRTILINMAGIDVRDYASTFPAFLHGDEQNETLS